MNDAAREERIGSLGGVRLCVRCGYNLVHQPILREARYGLFIVRCPECATVADLACAAPLGRWGGRLGMALAVAWIALVAAVIFFIGFGCAGMGIAATEIAADPVRGPIDAEWEVYEAEQIAATPAGQTLRGGSNLFAGWWAGLDRRAFLARHGGFWSVASPSALWITPLAAIYAWLTTSFVIFIMAPFARRWRALVYGLTVACAIGTSGFITWEVLAATPWWHWQAATQLVIPVTMPVALAAALGGFALAFITCRWTALLTQKTGTKADAR